MPQRDDAWLRQQQQRFMRPDAARWLRPDVARFLIPGTDPAEVCPALARKWAGQPRLPKDNDGGGQYTFGRMNVGPAADPDRVRVYITKPDLTSDELDVDDSDDEGDDGNDNFLSWLQLAGDLPDGLGTPGDEPPRIPTQKPRRSSERNALLRRVTDWLGPITRGLTGPLLEGLMNNADWILNYQDLINANRDPPMTLQELQANAGKKRPGYDDHHIIERSSAGKGGVTADDIDSPDNIVSIPRLKHYRITGWYMTKNDDFGKVSPREYLRNKGLEERRRVGLDALIKFGVLRP
jgi:hypothetical protein